ncbi:tryptophan synthase subunit alpha [Arcanobacterium hippocoleae]
MFIPFFTCGDPNIETTAQCIHAAVKAGAGIVEIGIPFSDPTAEGPVIQAASLRALNNGMTTNLAFETVRKVRDTYGVAVPICFMTYANVVFSYGAANFAACCAEVGVQGVILPDLPFEEREEFLEVFDAYGIALISLIAPTSAGRIAMIAREARGFIYLVSSLGVTGIRTQITTDLDEIVRVVRENTDVPCAIGFGISTPEQAHTMSRKADGVIVGSAIVKLIQEHCAEAPKYVGEYAARMTEAIFSAKVIVKPAAAFGALIFRNSNLAVFAINKLV